MRTSAFFDDFDRFTPNDLEGQGQPTSFSMGVWRVPRYIFGANLMIPDRKHYELLCGQQILKTSMSIMFETWPRRFTWNTKCMIIGSIGEYEAVYMKKEYDLCTIW